MIVRLLAPDWSDLDTIWRNPLPFILWPVGNQPLLAHWLDEAVRGGFEEVEIHVKDRADEVRAYLARESYWSQHRKVFAVAREADAPVTAERVDRLPGRRCEGALPKTAAALLTYWFELQKSWLARRSPREMTLDTFRPGGGWVGSHARIHRSARLRPPYWIGPGAEIGANCQIGPHALIGEESIVDENVEVEQACLLPNTYLGQNTRLFRAAAAGGALIDFGRSCRVDIGETFIMGPALHSMAHTGLGSIDGARAGVGTHFRADRSPVSAVR
jgi:NDP-sugar pyrophosphorylase family protein